MSISLDKVHWSSGGSIIVNGVTLDAAPGTTLGLLGPNGSGKSSLLRLICRIRKVQSGVITLGGEDIATLSQAQIARSTAFVEQQATTEIQVSVRDVVRLGRTPHRSPIAIWKTEDESAVQDALSHVGMLDKASRLWHTLSGGEKQRVHIARALAQTPSQLLLDEPTNHLDIQHQLDILALVSRLPVTCIVALHDLNLAAMFCDNLAVMHVGEIVAFGTPEEVLTETLIRDVFGVSARIERSSYHGRCHIQYKTA
ncbi:ABC transporter ATP-binding protein [Agrobacterium sp.]|uniref:ABC transporter ATP-binding protein n=1 Tax=Agrobacterium sp. TaxID=361 RepID=UPI0028A5879A|nr:ABC transporter ATP-binding protein [Agrobacterium sp.]